MFYKKIVSMALISLLIFSNPPLCMAASTLETTMQGVYVHGLPVPEIIKVDAANSVIELKANGYMNTNADLLITVSLVDGSGNVLDVAEKKVSDPDNIRVSLRTDKIKKGSMIYAKLSNHGIEGDGADHLHNKNQPGNGGGGGGGGDETKTVIETVETVVYVVTEAEPEEVIVEKVIAQEVPSYNIPAFINDADKHNNEHINEDSETQETSPNANPDDMIILGELLASTQPGEAIIKPKILNFKNLILLMIILSLVLSALIAFILKTVVSQPTKEIPLLKKE